MIVLAQFGKPHGLRGEMTLRSFTHDPASIFTYKDLKDEEGRPYTITFLYSKTANTYVVRVAGIDNRTSAEKITNIVLGVEELPKLENDEFYLSELIGCRVIDEKDQDHGIVCGFFNYGAGDVLEIKKESTTITTELNYVSRVDLEKRVIFVPFLYLFS